MTTKFKDLTGKTFGGFTALSRAANPTSKPATYWLCRCHCGKEKVVAYTTLVKAKTRGCGCLQFAGSHGLSYDSRYQIYTHARRSSRTRGIHFDITPEDIEAPSVCPVLGIELTYGGTGIVRDTSASIDRVDNSLGYIKGNIRIISNRANRLKSNATADELQAIVNYMNNHKETKTYE